MAAAVYDFEVAQNEIFTRTLFTDDLGDLQTKVIKMQLRKSVADPIVVAEAACVAISATQFTVTLTAEQTKAIGAPGVDTTLKHDLFVGNVRIWRGTCVVRGRVTRE